MPRAAQGPIPRIVLVLRMRLLPQPFNLVGLAELVERRCRQDHFDKDLGFADREFELDKSVGPTFGQPDEFAFRIERGTGHGDLLVSCGRLVKGFPINKRAMRREL